MAIKLTVKLLDQSTSAYTFSQEEREITVGRDPTCHVSLPFPFISQHQFTIISEGKTYFLADNGATNSTFLNEEMLSAHSFTPLKMEDVIKVGDVEIGVEMIPELESTLSLDESNEHVRKMVWDVLSKKGTSASIEIVSGPDRGGCFPLSGAQKETLIGGSPKCDLQLKDPLCSPEHLKICRQDRGYLLVPLSEQLCKLRGEVIIEPELLSHGDRILLGNSELRFTDPIQYYLTELSPRHHPPGKAGNYMGSNTLRIPQEVVSAIKRRERNFGPPNRPPNLSSSQIGDNYNNDSGIIVQPSLEKHTPSRWGAFEYTSLVAAIFLFVLGLITVLVIFNLFHF